MRLALTHIHLAVISTECVGFAAAVSSYFITGTLVALAKFVGHT